MEFGLQMAIGVPLSSGVATRHLKEAKALTS
jgi:hypothetical protein